MNELVIHTVIRISLTQPFVIFIFIFMLNVILERRRSLKYFILYMVFKVIFENIVLNFLLIEYIYKSMFLYCLYVWIVIILSGLSYLVPYYTFSSEPTKLLATMLLSDCIITFCVYGSLGICNILKNKQGRDFSGYLQPFEVLIPVISLCLFLIIYFFMKPYFHKFRKIEIKYKKICWAVYISYLVVAFISMVRNPYVSNKWDAMLIYVYQIICIITVFVVGMSMFFRYKRFVLRENEFLKSEQQLIEAHYDTLKGQTEQIQNYQQDIQEQMQMIERFKTDEISNEKITEYLWKLKHEYYGLKVGIYCDEWVIDAVLMQQGKICEDKGIKFAVSMHNFDIELIQEGMLVQFLIQLFEQVINETSKVTKKENRSIFFQCTRVGNQLLIELKYGCIGNQLYMNMKIRRYLFELKEKININVNQKDGIGHIIIMLQS